MKSGTCPKCGSKDIRCKQDAGDHHQMGTAGFSNVYCTVYVCAGCGFLEDFIEGDSLSKVREKWPKRS